MGMKVSNRYTYIICIVDTFVYQDASGLWRCYKYNTGLQTSSEVRSMEGPDYRGDRICKLNGPRSGNEKLSGLGRDPDYRGSGLQRFYCI